MIVKKPIVWAVALSLWLAGSIASKAGDSPSAPQTAIIGAKVVLAVNLQAYWSDRLRTLSDRIDTVLRAGHIKYASLIAPDNQVAVIVSNKTRVDDAKLAVDHLAAEDQENDSDGVQIYQVALRGKTLTISITPKYMSAQNFELMSQSIEVVRRHMQSFATGTVTIRALDRNLLEVDVPGFSDLARIREYFSPPDQLTLHLVDGSVSDSDIKRKNVPADDQVLTQQAPENGVKTQLAIQKKVLLSGERINDVIAAVSITGQPVVEIRFDHVGGDIFAKVTRENVGRRLAFVLGDQILNAPNIMDPVLGGMIELDGHFSREAAENLATLLRGSTIPASFRIISVKVGTLPN